MYASIIRLTYIHAQGQRFDRLICMYRFAANERCVKPRTVVPPSPDTKRRGKLKASRHDVQTLCVTIFYLKVWRLVTCFLFFGYLGFNFLFNMVFLYLFALTVSWMVVNVVSMFCFAVTKPIGFVMGCLSFVSMEWEFGTGQVYGMVSSKLAYWVHFLLLHLCCYDWLGFIDTGYWCLNFQHSYRFSRKLEEGCFAGNPAGFIVMLLFGAVLSLVSYTVL